MLHHFSALFLFSLDHLIKSQRSCILSCVQIVPDMFDLVAWEAGTGSFTSHYGLRLSRISSDIKKVFTPLCLSTPALTI